MLVQLSDDIDGGLWKYTYICSCDAFGKVKLLKVRGSKGSMVESGSFIYSFGSVRQDKSKAMLLYNPVRNSVMAGGVCVCKVSESKVAGKYGYAWEKYGGSTLYTRNSKKIDEKTYRKAIDGYRAVTFSPC